jgi:DNA topoisomerase-1
MNRAVEVLAQKAAGGRGRGGAAAAKPLRELGVHPSGGPVQVMPGRYGPYVKWDKVNATLPKDIDPEAVTLDQALELIAAKAGKGKPAKAKAAARKPAAAKAKPAAKAKAPAKTADKTAAKSAAKSPAKPRAAARGKAAEQG